MNVQRLVAVALFSISSFLISCGTKEETFDAQGVFEADEVIISSSANGRILQFGVEEGQTITAGEEVAGIDSTQLVLQKKQLQAQIRAVLSQTPDVATQIASLQEQISAAKREKERVAALVGAGALPSKQLDDAGTQVDVLNKQLDALQSSLSINKQGLQAQTQPLIAQIEQVSDQLGKCSIRNPIDGTVLTTYAEQGEMTAVGKPLYKIADLSTMTLRAYINGSQFAQVKLGQTVKVFIDDGPEKYREVAGTISWISNQAEFTPKTIQTKDERANLVYAIKIKVPNDGALKLGMYGEVRF